MGVTMSQIPGQAVLSWLEKNGSAMRVYQRASLLTGLTMESAENLQVLNYATGGHYNEHTDPVDREEDEGERLATLLVYLSDVKQGGSTAFPEADRVAPPPFPRPIFPSSLVVGLRSSGLT
ncbi:hypothetical protein MTO96_040597 [Rhipicephalus appendiculatus]